MRRTTTTAALTLLLLVTLAAPALAHASFDVTALPAGSTQELVLRVPLEREDDNALVEVLVPGAFTIDACPGADGWSCDTADTADGDTVVTLTNDGGDGSLERFALTLTAPAAEGVYAFPTIQTYADGTEAPWIGEPGTDQPAPRIQVGDATTEVEFAGDATPHTELADDATAEPSEAATTDPSEPAAGDEVTDAPTDEPAPTPDAVEATPDDAPTQDDLAEDDASSDEGGTSTLLLVLLGVVVLGAVVAVALRGRSGGTA